MQKMADPGMLLKKALGMCVASKAASAASTMGILLTVNDDRLAADLAYIHAISQVMHGDNNKPWR